MTDLAAIRNADLRHMLSQRRREIRADVRNHVRDRRADDVKDVHDELDDSEADIQADLRLALLQMRSETLIRIDEALARLDAGQYGSCSECAGEIAEQRLRALPFAVRCQTCEGRREQERGHARRVDEKRATLALVSEGVRP